MLDFIEIRVLDIIDILLVSILLYTIYRLIKNSVAMYIFLGISFVYAFWKLVVVLQLDLLSEILGKFMSVGFIILIVVFQKEIRNFLTIIGTSNIKSKNIFIKKFYKKTLKINTYISDIVDLLYELSRKKTGVLIVIEKNANLSFLVNTGDEQNITVTKSILESIFYPNSPLHDGAVIISKGKIICTRAILPISKDSSISSRYGMRHRAAVGISEETDCVCLVVSEETGDISYIENGIIKKITIENREKIVEILNF